LIWKKFWVFSQKYLREEAELRVDFVKYQGLFCKMTKARPVWAVHAPDPTAGNGRRRDHAAWPSFGAGFIEKRRDVVGQSGCVGRRGSSEFRGRGRTSAKARRRTKLTCPPTRVLLRRGGVVLGRARRIADAGERWPCCCRHGKLSLRRAGACPRCPLALVGDGLVAGTDVMAYIYAP
jgi:hypothetical protein